MCSAFDAVQEIIGRSTADDDMWFQAQVSVGVCGFELPPKDGSIDGSPITAVSEWRTASIGLPVGRAVASTASLIGERLQCDIGSVCRFKYWVEGSGEREVVLVIE